MLSDFAEGPMPPYPRTPSTGIGSLRIGNDHEYAVIARPSPVEAGLSRIRFHDLRHTHASLLVAAGVPIKVVAERLGHAHPGFNMHTYQHLLPGMGATAASQFADLIAGSGRSIYRPEPRQHSVSVSDRGHSR